MIGTWRGVEIGNDRVGSFVENCDGFVSLLDGNSRRCCIEWFFLVFFDAILNDVVNELVKRADEVRVKNRLSHSLAFLIARSTIDTIASHITTIISRAARQLTHPTVRVTGGHATRLRRRHAYRRYRQSKLRR